MRTPHRPVTILLMLLLGIGCAPARSTPSPGPGQAASPRCAEVAAAWRAHPDTFVVTPPRVRTIRVPPVEGAPMELTSREIRVAMPVDARGMPIADSATFSPEIRDRGYLSTFRESLSKYRFTPATTEGCGIPSVYTWTVTIERPPL